MPLWFLKKNKMKYKISVIGAGNGGQAMAGHLALMGHDVTLYNRNLGKISRIQENGGIYLKGEIEGFGIIKKVTNNIQEAIELSEILMVVTTANAHGQLAKAMLPYLKSNQIIVLNPGRTGGAFEIHKIFNDGGLTKDVYIVECQSLVYACRQEIPGNVRVFGVKDRVYYSTFPTNNLEKVQDKISDIYKCMLPVANVLITSLENMGAIFHPTLVTFNAASIERGEQFYFYNDITPKVCLILEKVDKERLSIGEAFGLKLKPAEEWITYAYEGIQGNDLLSKMKFNPAYYKIIAPKELKSRLLTEDIPTGILPMIELGKLAGLELPLMNAIYNLAEGLLDENFKLNGRTLEKLGLKDMSVNDILKMLE